MVVSLHSAEYVHSTTMALKATEASRETHPFCQRDLLLRNTPSRSTEKAPHSCETVCLRKIRPVEPTPNVLTRLVADLVVVLCIEAWGEGLSHVTPSAIGALCADESGNVNIDGCATCVVEQHCNKSMTAMA